MAKTTVTLPTVQEIIAYASIVMGILTTQLSAVKLPTWGSVILGVFGVLLHPQTSVTAPAPAPAEKPTPAP